MDKNAFASIVAALTAYLGVPRYQHDHLPGADDPARQEQGLSATARWEPGPAAFRWVQLAWDPFNDRWSLVACNPTVREWTLGSDLEAVGTAVRDWMRAAP